MARKMVGKCAFVSAEIQLFPCLSNVILTALPGATQNNCLSFVKLTLFPNSHTKIGRVAG